MREVVKNHNHISFGVDVITAVIKEAAKAQLFKPNDIKVKETSSL